MPKWNEQQRRAVETRERNILVSASAGSGKTTVLVGRLMDLVIKDKISVDQILAMTFTEAAANEMKKRLSASLQQEIAQTQDPFSFKAPADTASGCTDFNHSLLLSFHPAAILLCHRLQCPADSEYCR